MARSSAHTFHTRHDFTPELGWAAFQLVAELGRDGVTSSDLETAARAATSPLARRADLTKVLASLEDLGFLKGRVYLLSGLLRCQCGAHMVGASAHGRTAVNYYYVCTRQQHEGGKYSCQSSRIPAEAFENALIGRIRDIGRMVEARDRIVQETLSCLGDESVRLREEEELTRRRVAQVRADIGRLVEVLKSLGARGLASVQAELERLESEESQLKRSLADIATRQEPVERVSDDARSFLETWVDIGELLEAATPEERMQILQHYIEVVELGLIEPETRTGSYAMRLFPEVRPDRGFDFGGEKGPNDLNPGPETTNGANPGEEDGSACVNPGRFGSHNRQESSPARIRT